jgi:XisH protein
LAPPAGFLDTTRVAALERCCMPPHDRDHDAVCAALVADGWSITNDPLHLRYAGDDIYIDLAAEQLIAAEKGLRRIAVEIKSFSGPSELADLHGAVGQFVVYREVLAEIDPERELYLAVTEEVRTEVFESGVAQLLLARQIRRLVSIDPARKVIVQWIP